MKNGTEKKGSSWFRQWGFGLLISLVALIAAFWGFKPARLIEVVAQGNYWYVFPAVLVLILGLLTRAGAWRRLLFEEVRFRRAFSALTQGYLANNALPLRIGEIVRAYAVSFDQDLGVLRALPSIIIERIIDVFFGLVFLAISITFLVVPEWSQQVIWAAAGFLVLMLFVTVILVWRGDDLVHFLQRAPIPGLPGMARVSDEFIASLKRIVGNPITVIFAAALLLLSWTTVWIQLGLIASVFGVSLGLPALMFVSSVTAFGAALPASPGAVGVFELVAVAGLIVFGLDREIALSIAILWHGTVLVMTSLLGAITLARDSRSLREIGANAQSFYTALREA